MTTNHIATWRERIGASDDFPLHAPTVVERAMVAEIADLRARLEQSDRAYSIVVEEARKVAYGQLAHKGQSCETTTANLQDVTAA